MVEDRVIHNAAGPPGVFIWKLNSLVAARRQQSCAGRARFGVRRRVVKSFSRAPKLARGGMPTGIAGRRIATMKMQQQGEDSKLSGHSDIFATIV